MQIIFYEDFSDDIEEIYSYISKDSITISQRFIFELIDYIYTLSVFPELGRLIEKQYNIRKLVYRNYIVLYYLNYYSNTIYIVKIFHYKQDINIILSQIEKYI